MAAPDTSNLQDFLQHLRIMTIAVIDETGKPWAVPVGVRSYKNGQVTWRSKTDTVHSNAIAKNAEVMLIA